MSNLKWYDHWSSSSVLFKCFLVKLFLFDDKNVDAVDVVVVVVFVIEFGCFCWCKSSQPLPALLLLIVVTIADCPPPPLYDCGDDDDPPIISVSQPSLQSFIKLFNWRWLLLLLLPPIPLVVVVDCDDFENDSKHESYVVGGVVVGGGCLSVGRKGKQNQNLKKI